MFLLMQPIFYTLLVFIEITDSWTTENVFANCCPTKVLPKFIGSYNATTKEVGKYHLSKINRDETFLFLINVETNGSNPFW